MSILLTVEAWADIVIKEWHKKIEKYNIGNTGQLARSFVHHILTNSGGDPSRVEFAFEYYGKFVDWGVGNGIRIGNPGDLGFTPLRKKKPWFTSVFYLQVKILAEQMAKTNAELTAVILTEGMQEALSTSAPGKRSRTGGSRSSIDSVTGKRKPTMEDLDNTRKVQGW